jgi:hypothetical protein
MGGYVYVTCNIMQLYVKDLGICEEGPKTILMDTEGKL